MTLKEEFMAITKYEDYEKQRDKFRDFAHPSQVENLKNA